MFKPGDVVNIKNSFDYDMGKGVIVQKNDGYGTYLVRITIENNVFEWWCPSHNLSLCEHFLKKKRKKRK